MKYLRLFEDERMDDDTWRTIFKNDANIVFVNSKLTKKYKFKIGEIVYYDEKYDNKDKYDKYEVTAIDLDEVLEQPYRLCSIKDDSCGTWSSEKRMMHEYEIDASKYNL